MEDGFKMEVICFFKMIYVVGSLAEFLGIF